MIIYCRIISKWWRSRWIWERSERSWKIVVTRELRTAFATSTSCLPTADFTTNLALTSSSSAPLLKRPSTLVSRTCLNLWALTLHTSSWRHWQFHLLTLISAERASRLVGRYEARVWGCQEQIHLSGDDLRHQRRSDLRAFRRLGQRAWLLDVPLGSNPEAGRLVLRKPEDTLRSQR